MTTSGTVQRIQANVLKRFMIKNWKTKLPRKIAIMRKQLYDKHIERDNLLLEFIWKQISSLKDKLGTKHTFLLDVLQNGTKFK